ncbi:hypothetical protein [Pandoraea faecigallinarum]|uniref:hypothetical protein n=1 Tax=Pandoraea faecigallinarum TaxID=656179 RepID=UPI000A6F0926|nr:hypothetical protein [Pandoraea faecigallinarum]
MSEIELDAIKSKFIPLEDIAMSFATSIVDACAVWGERGRTSSVYHGPRHRRTIG